MQLLLESLGKYATATQGDGRNTKNKTKKTMIGLSEQNKTSTRASLFQPTQTFLNFKLSALT